MVSFILVIIVILSVLVCATTLSFFIAYIHGAMVVSTKNDIIRHALTVARVKRRDTLVDFGSGWGNVIHIARTEFGARAIGYEIALIPYLFSRLRGEHVHLCSFIKGDTTHATIVYMYLSPEVLRSLVPQIQLILARGVRIVTISFHIPGITPLRLEKYHRHTIYVYS